MAASANRFLALLLRIIRARSKIVALASRGRQAKAGRPSASGQDPSSPDGCTLATAVALPSETPDSVVATPRAPQQAPFSVQRRVTIDCLPFELLCDCLASFPLEDLLPLRLISKTWVAAVNAQDAFSRIIEYRPSVAADDEPGEPGLDGTFDLFVARITCSSRPICLDVTMGCLRDRDAEVVCTLISEHLERIESLSVSFAPGGAAAVFGALRLPASRLRALTLLHCPKGDSRDSEMPCTAARIPPDVFAGHAPLLEWASLTDCAVDPSGSYPALLGVRHLWLRIRVQDCSGPFRMLALCPQLEFMSIDTEFSLDQLDDLPPLDMAAFPLLHALRIIAHPLNFRLKEQGVDLLNALTTPATRQVCLPIPRKEHLDAMLDQMRGLGPFTFSVDTCPGKVDEDSGKRFHTMHMHLISLSTQRLRGVEVHEFDHWEWEGREEALLHSFAERELAHDILTVHIALRPGALYNPLALLCDIVGTWPSVRTLRIDLLGGTYFRPRLDSAFPALCQIVLFHPYLPLDTSYRRLFEISSRFFPFFDRSSTDPVAVVVTRDSAAADVVTAYPWAAYSNPHCVVFSWQRDIDPRRGVIESIADVASGLRLRG
ncbi:hypothetical protein AURDEDRAFT_163889 [Auricularia subglabra TFB-10046 SS5]|nr:hypothetical protein AURDEDRAFT_163889 [Auricularia subglabra TFB-10046 SS5]